MESKVRWIGGMGVGVALGITFLLFHVWSQNQSEDRPYHFPVQPGTVAWSQLQSRAEMVRVTTIPPQVLARLSTPALVETVLAYPLFGDVRAHNSRQQGMAALAEDFNGIQALYGRPDAGRLLLAHYTALTSQTLETSDHQATAFRLWQVELLLAQAPLHTALTPDEQRTLLDATLQAAHFKAQQVWIYGQNGQEQTAWLAGRVLLQLDPTMLERFDPTLAEEAAAFLSKGGLVRPQVPELLLQKAQQESASSR